MTSKDERRLTEDEIDEIVDRVVGRLGAEGEDPAPGDIEDVSPGGTEDRETRVDEEAGRGTERDREPGEGHVDRRAEEVAERAEARAERLEDRVERGSERLERLGERIEDRVERRLDRLADHLERAFEEPEPRRGRGPHTEPGRERAVYKTQLQKGGRVAVPDAEIEALDLEPGDTLQVTLYGID